jgi:S-adenosylmethionine synthetase
MSSAALSGKDPTRIDRIGVCAERNAANNLVDAGPAEQCEVQLSYSIGLPGPDRSSQRFTLICGRDPLHVTFINKPMTIA